MGLLELLGMGAGGAGLFAGVGGADFGGGGGGGQEFGGFGAGFGNPAPEM